jgi:hypothetical protein
MIEFKYIRIGIILRKKMPFHGHNMLKLAYNARNGKEKDREHGIRMPIFFIYKTDLQSLLRNLLS